jgi:hypothetical protein
MGAGEVPAVSRRSAPALLAVAALALGALAGCGEEEPQANVSATETLGPASAEGDIEKSKAQLLPEDGFSTLVSTQISTRGEPDTLVAGQVELLGAEPELRLKVDGERERRAQVTVSEQDGSRVALVSCACNFPTGEHTVVIEGAADGAQTSVGPRTLVVFPEVDLKETGPQPVSQSALDTADKPVTAEGETLVSTQPTGGDGAAIVLVSVSSPRSLTGADNVRLAVTIGEDQADELARTTLPGGKIAAYLDPNGAGEPVEVRGYTTSGQTPVGVASIIVCNCGVERGDPASEQGS